MEAQYGAGCSNASLLVYPGSMAISLSYRIVVNRALMFVDPRKVSLGSSLCENACCFVRVADPWVWMIYRGVFCGFVESYIGF